MMIKKYTLKALQQAINHAFSLDDSRYKKLLALEGKVVKLVVKPLNVAFYLQFNQAKLRLLESYDGVPNTTIHSSPLGLIRLSILPASQMRSLFNNDISLTGDVELGQEVKQLFDQLDIDWEGYLARFTGDVIAYQLGSWFKKGRAFQHYVAESIPKQITEYIHDDARLLPSSEEVQDFFHDIDQLVLDVARIEAHIKLYIEHYEPI